MVRRMTECYALRTRRSSVADRGPRTCRPLSRGPLTGRANIIRLTPVAVRRQSRVIWGRRVVRVGVRVSCPAADAGSGGSASRRRHRAGNLRATGCRRPCGPIGRVHVDAVAADDLPFIERAKLAPGHTSGRKSMTLTCPRCASPTWRTSVLKASTRAWSSSGHGRPSRRSLPGNTVRRGHDFGSPRPARCRGTVQLGAQVRVESGPRCASSAVMDAVEMSQWATSCTDTSGRSRRPPGPASRPLLAPGRQVVRERVVDHGRRGDATPTVPAFGSDTP